MCVFGDVSSVPSLEIGRKFDLSSASSAVMDPNRLLLSGTGAALSAALAAENMTPVRRSTIALDCEEWGAV